MYRLSRSAHQRGKPNRALLISGINRFLTGVEIDPMAVIGDRIKIIHGSGTVIGAAVIGEDCIIMQGVTIGLAGLERLGYFPTLGDRVLVYAGAAILGDVTIGDDVVVGANAVVTKDVPSGSVVGGVPARILKGSDRDVKGTPPPA
jgi:serine O-acetyltransferase